MQTLIDDRTNPSMSVLRNNMPPAPLKMIVCPDFLVVGDSLIPIPKG
ncbi:hypothetical protein PLANPX_3269 [Lacipirellula parvula]|uniref:Uncharacterized protein n=1 Tax=Lacipirellula parvula TaxID=2650471 RepID=A0A5K7XCA9_9BACT|nr:hypothetical protein PLANPX_3269 [Lacipirellula parvula]